MECKALHFVLSHSVNHNLVRILDWIQDMTIRFRVRTATENPHDPFSSS